MTDTEQRKIFGVSKTVFALGIVSFLTDVSSEMLVPVLPQFLSFVLGAPGQLIGAIEGIAECTASILRVYAGYLADRFGRPKLLTVIGYSLSALSKPLLIPAASWTHVLGVRFADRFGKGIRSAPRDVLIASASDASMRGRAFGLHRAMDTAGATLGPLLVLLIVWLLAKNTHITSLGRDRNVYTVIFIAASLPALLGVAVLLGFVPEQKSFASKADRPALHFSSFDARYKMFLGIVMLFAIGNSSDAFLVLKATSKAGVGMGMINFLWVYVAFNALQAIVAYRSGTLSDKIGRKPLIAAGWIVFAVCYFAIALVKTPLGVWVWYLVYGVYYGLTEGTLRAFAMDMAPAHLRGSAIGAYYTFSGLALLPASIIGGYLWDINSAYPFFYGAATSLAAAILLLVFVHYSPPNKLSEV